MVRADLSPGQQAVQAMHALREFVQIHPEIDGDWYRSSNTLALLSVPSLEDLAALRATAGLRGIPYAEFREPDLRDELTAVALAPGADTLKLCRSLALALRREK